MAALFQHHLVVQPEDIDTLNHANNLAYLRWTQAAAAAHSTSVGWSHQRHLDAGLVWVVRSHQIKYLRPALLGEQLTIHTWICSFDGATTLRRYRVVRPSDDKLLAVAQTMWVFLDLKKGLPKRIPPDIADCYGYLPDHAQHDFRFDTL